MKDKTHPLVAKTAAMLERREPNLNGFVSAGTGGLDVWLGPESVARALRLLEGLLGRFEAEGWKVTVQERDRKHLTVFRVDGEEFSLTLRERIQQTPHRPTPSEKAQPDYLVPKFDRSPSRDLHLIIESTGLLWNISLRWRDAKHRKLEGCIDDVVVRVREAAVTVKERRAEHERAEAARQEQTSRKEGARERELRHQRDIQALIDEAGRWRSSRLVRDYIAAVREAAGGTDSEVGEWLAWAEGVEVELDPLPARSLSTTTRDGGSGHEV